MSLWTFGQEIQRFALDLGEVRADAAVTGFWDLSCRVQGLRLRVKV